MVIASPTESENMPTVDSEGRVVLPREVLERLGITPGSEMEIREEDGQVVIEPEDDPDEIVADLEGLIEAATAERDRTSDDDLDAQSRDHVDTIRRRASESDDGDE